MKTRIQAVILLLLTIFGSLLFLLPSSALNDPELTEDCSVLLYHNDSGTILYEKSKGSYLPSGPAARLMAGIIFAEHYEQRAKETVTVNRKVPGLASSELIPGLKGGEELSAYDLLCALLISNSNDALYALAFDLYGDSASAPQLLLLEMNRRAEEWGMHGTKFYNVTGQDPQNDGESYNYSSVNDLLLLSLKAQENTFLSSICRIEDYTVPATNKSESRRLLQRNYLLSAKRVPGFTYEYATGLSAGSSLQGGHSALCTAEINGQKYTCVVMNAQNTNGAFPLAKTLFEWGRTNFSYRKILSRTEILGEIQVELSGDSDYITVAPERNFSAFLPNDTTQEELTRQIRMDYEKLEAPVREGMIAGSVTLFCNGEELARVNLLTIGSIPLSNRRYYFSLAKNFFTSPLFLWGIGGLAVLLLVYVLVNARVRYLRKNRPTDLEYDAGDSPGSEGAPVAGYASPEEAEEPAEEKRQEHPAGDGLSPKEKQEERPNGHSAGEPTEKPKEKSAKPPSEGKTENKEAQIQAEGIREEPPAAPENPEGRTFYNVEEDEPFDRDEEASLPPEQPPVKNPSDYVPDGWGEKR